MRSENELQGGSEAGRRAPGWGASRSDSELEFIHLFHRQRPGRHVKALAPLLEAAEAAAGARGGRPALVRLLSHGDSRGFTPLHWAVQHGGGSEHAARLLLTHGAPVDARAENGTTPLHFAVTGARWNAIKSLVEFGADMEAEDSSGARPMHMAAARGHADVVSWLLKWGNDPAAPDAAGFTPAHFASLRAESAKALEALLVEGGAPVSALDNQNRTAMHVACAHGVEAAVLLLLPRGSNPLANDTAGLSPLDYCERHGRAMARAVMNLRMAAGISQAADRGELSPSPSPAAAKPPRKRRAAKKDAEAGRGVPA